MLFHALSVCLLVFEFQDHQDRVIFFLLVGGYFFQFLVRYLVIGVGFCQVHGIQFDQAVAVGDSCSVDELRVHLAVVYGTVAIDRFAPFRRYLATRLLWVDSPLRRRL